jgi:hypothetical protein
MAVTKAQEVYDRVEAMVAAGTDKADAFRQIAEEAGRPFDSVRGSYYSHKKKLEGGDSAKPARTRRRETTHRPGGRGREGQERRGQGRARRPQGECRR